jgi:hypothetical protein
MLVRHSRVGLSISTAAAIATIFAGSSADAGALIGPSCPEDPGLYATSLPILSGTPRSGSTLTVTAGTWGGGTPNRYAYTWYSNGANVRGSGLVTVTTDSYVLQPSDVGHVVYVDVYAAVRCISFGRANSNQIQVGADGEEMGTHEPDQSVPVAPDSDPTGPAPQAMSPTGIVSPTTYTTENWTADETGTPDGLGVVATTATGTSAISGVALDAATNQPLPGATVSLSSATTTTTTTDANGSYAFINMPSASYAVTLNAPGYGTYTVNNESLAPNEHYELTSALDTMAQTFDASTSASAQNGSAGSAPGTSYSQTRVPPSVNVGVYPLAADCSRASNSFSVVNYPWKYYLLRVAKSEVLVNHYNQVGQKAFLALAQNYGWFHKTLGGVYDIENSTNRQCFRNWATVPASWRTWVNDVLDERVVSPSSQLYETHYLAGTFPPPRCPDPAPGQGQNGTYASQWTIKLLSEGGNANAGCFGRTDWRSIVTYWYPAGTQVVGGLRPPVPVTSFTTGSGKIYFHFTARQYGANTAWSFALRIRTPSGWAPLGKRVGWYSRTYSNGDCTVSARSIANCLAYTPPDSECHRYAVVARNPVNDSLTAAFTSAGYGISPSGLCTL